jgi:hypothetical protein
MPDAQMTGTAADFQKFHVALAQGGHAANGYQRAYSQRLLLRIA